MYFNAIYAWFTVNILLKWTTAQKGCKNIIYGHVFWWGIVLSINSTSISYISLIAAKLSAFFAHVLHCSQIVDNITEDKSDAMWLSEPLNNSTFLISAKCNLLAWFVTLATQSGNSFQWHQCLLFWRLRILPFCSLIIKLVCSDNKSIISEVMKTSQKSAGELAFWSGPFGPGVNFITSLKWVQATNLEVYFIYPVFLSFPFNPLIFDVSLGDTSGISSGSDSKQSQKHAHHPLDNHLCFHFRMWEHLLQFLRLLIPPTIYESRLVGWLVGFMAY